MKIKILPILMILVFLNLSCSYALDVSQYQASYFLNPDKANVNEIFVVKASANDELVLARGNAWDLSIDSTKLEWGLVRENNTNLIKIRFPYTGTYQFKMQYLRSDFLSSKNSLNIFQTTLPEVSSISTPSVTFSTPSDYQFGFTNPVFTPITETNGTSTVSFSPSHSTDVYIQFANFANLTQQRKATCDELNKQFQSTINQLNGVLGVVKIFNANYIPPSLPEATKTNNEARKHVDSASKELQKGPDSYKTAYEEAGIAESLSIESVNKANGALNEAYGELMKNLAVFLLLFLVILLVVIRFTKQIKKGKVKDSSEADTSPKKLPKTELLKEDFPKKESPVVEKPSNDEALPKEDLGAKKVDVKKSDDVNKDSKPSKTLLSINKRMKSNIDSFNQLSRDIEKFGFTVIKKNRKTEKNYKNILYNILEPLDNCKKYLIHLKKHKEDLKNENKLTNELESEINREIERLEAIENNLEIVLKYENVSPSTSIGDSYNETLHIVEGGGANTGATIKEILEQGYVQDEDVLRLAVVKLDGGE